MPSRKATDPGEAKALADIEAYGCHILHVLEEGDDPPFTYSVGIEHNFKAPELIVIGLKPEISQFIINEYCSRVRSGEVFQPGQRSSGFIEGFDCQFGAVHIEHYREHFGWDLWFYDGLNFGVLQLIYPTVDGIWPWQTEASDWFRTWQPLLDTAPSS
ncbi:DUF4262 domain-containing protein [Mesorhizobium sp.]|uniref:DUF4262 domain-containing protein n=1 Tax=Mesorhizobium sp. TaxID=1871066 RepID=UPI000FE8BA07|nr:DUF4262 domain-containing protein [Mesorhizobium sp.]RWB06721.1 MAG: DUF4262 domain-containing protein [Mesorhizobium sp.]RWB13948.1 MAG: DUF4262 domain-containing protein [Mesorhizobium sp.]RWO86632.1 MAG: DUF4262 domain-containing protein [Mesorhizobium sp.]TIM98441.1 MAG: DUF4262 domain-containing protein [Mesorhizobium sp.]TIN67307.1 MAG: DUF4262 domain-containing protein [Mesorhizobium sp.]